MNFHRYNSSLLLLAVLTGLTCAMTTTPTYSTSVKKTIPLKATAPVQETRHPYSLEGKSFNEIDDDARLDDEDAEIYTQIFALQDVGDFKQANNLINDLDDHRLMGHILAQRYLHRAYKSTFKELADWMQVYNDLPQAPKIYALAYNHKTKSDTAAITLPNISKGMTAYHEHDSGQLAQPYMASQNHTPQELEVMAQISRSLANSPTAAFTKLEEATKKNIFNETKRDALQAQIAESYFYNGNIPKAYELASQSARRSGKYIPLAGWIAGLSAWKLQKYEDAARHFSQAAQSPRASSWAISAAAHWAARAYLRNHQPQKVSYWLHLAAQHPRSFYGIISAKALGMEQSRFNWKMPELSRKHIKKLAAQPQGKRALALMDTRNISLAEQELRQINLSTDKTLQEAMMALAHEMGTPAFEMRLGSGLQSKEGGLYDAALYPEAPWQPEGGYHVDKALVYAFVRQESKFEATVSNKSSGAIGVMQLMPKTALALARTHNIKADMQQLHEPATNLRLAQIYLSDLLKNSRVKNNLFKLAVAYNAGPGKLSRWEEQLIYMDDPLLFIESIPIAETRSFVERVLTNYWIYRIKHKKNTDSLEAVAAGGWPFYAE